MPTARYNRAQLRAINHDLDRAESRPLLVLAGPGTGKTRIVVGRARRLLATGAKSLVLAFGNRAVSEIKERLGTHWSRYQPEGGGSVRVGTFHAVGASWIRRFAREVGLQKDFIILSREEAMELLGRVSRQGGKKRKIPDPDECQEIYSLWVNLVEPLKAVLARFYPEHLERAARLERVFQCYEGAKRDANVVDFDDLLRLWLKLLRSHTGRKHGCQYDHVLVDEYQDISRLQYEILCELRPSGLGLFVVGDDAQCIYSWRGARIQNILEFERAFPKAKLIKLIRNYRSISPIVDLYNSVRAASIEGIPKSLTATRVGARRPRIVIVDGARDQARFVVNRVVRRRDGGMPFSQQAILFRQRRSLTRLIEELDRRGIPYQIASGWDLAGNSVIRVVRAIIRWAFNSKDKLAASLVLGILPAWRKVRDRSLKVQARSLMADSRIAVAGRRAWRRLLTVLRLIRRQKKSVAQILACIRRWYRTFLPQQLRRHGAAFRLLERVGRAARNCKSFLSTLALRIEGDGDQESTRQSDAVTLCSVHAAKGREWQCVSILDAVDGNFPIGSISSPAQYEEERRIFSVAVSRASRRLDLLYPKWGWHRRNGAQRLTGFLRHSQLQLCRVVDKEASLI